MKSRFSTVDRWVSCGREGRWVCFMSRVGPCSLGFITVTSCRDCLSWWRVISLEEWIGFLSFMKGIGRISFISSGCKCYLSCCRDCYHCPKSRLFSLVFMMQFFIAIYSLHYCYCCYYYCDFYYWYYYYDFYYWYYYYDCY